VGYISHSTLKLISPSMIDMPPLVLDAGSARQWLTPFTAQYERGEWDWEERGRAWYEVEQSLSNSVSPADSDSEQEVEDRKDR